MQVLLFNLRMPRVARRLRLAAGILGWVLVKSRLASLVAEVVRFASVFRLVLGRLLVHFHSTNRIFRQISTSYRILCVQILVVRASM